MTILADHDTRLQQMQAGVDALSEGFALFSNSDELVFCNTAFKHLYPDLNNFLKPGLPWAVFLLEANRKHGSAGLERLDAHLSSGINTPLTLETCEFDKRWFHIGIRWVDDGGFVLTQSDITDQYQAKEAIEHADDLLRNILDACASRIVVYGLQKGDILYRTPAWQETFGQVQNIRAIFSDPVSYADLLTDMLSTSRMDDQDTSMEHLAGHSFPTRISARMIDYQGESAVVMSIEDMTQLHQQRDAIVQSNQRLLDAIEALDQGFVLFDSDHRLLMANQHYLDVNKPISQHVNPGVPHAELMKHCLAENHEPLAAGLPQTHEKTEADQYEFELQDGRAFSVSRSITSDNGFVMTWRDVTEQRATERELTKRRETAFQNEKLSALGQLLAGVAHELNNPLSVVLGHAMMLKEDITDTEALEGIEKISLSAERCAKIVKTFLAMARQQPAQLEQCNLNDIIEMSLEIASYSIRKSGIDIQLQLDDNLPLVTVDEDQVTQVFINLMINAEQALKVNTVSPVLKISSHYDEDSNALVARISDNGPGIAEEHRLRIFEPFFTTKAVGEGTGVGLALSYRIMDSHGGGLNVSDSELGGATFVVRIPASNQQQFQQPETRQPENTGEIRALLVEDEPDVSDMMQKLLTSMGVDVTSAANAESGLNMLQNDPNYHVILCDLRMPGMGGMGMLQEIENRWPPLSERFVFVTGDAISEEVKSIRAAAKHRLIEKPVSPHELKTLLQSLDRTPEPLDRKEGSS